MPDYLSANPLNNTRAEQPTAQPPAACGCDNSYDSGSESDYSSSNPEYDSDDESNNNSRSNLSARFRRGRISSHYPIPRDKVRG